MNWQNQIVTPQRATPPKVNIRNPCPGLCRFACMASFLVVGLGIYYGGVRLFGLEPLDWGAPAWTAKHVALVAAGVVGGMLAGLFGFAHAMTIEVRDERWNRLFITLWQFLANGSMVWILAIGIAMSVSLGRDGAKEAVLSFGPERAILHVAGTGCAVGLLTGIVFFISPIIRLPFLAYFSITATISLLAARWHYQVYDIDGIAWLVAGLIVPVLLLVFAPAMIARDQQQRRLVMEQLP